MALSLEVKSIQQMRYLLLPLSFLILGMSSLIRFLPDATSPNGKQFRGAQSLGSPLFHPFQACSFLYSEASPPPETPSSFTRALWPRTP